MAIVIHKVYAVTMTSGVLSSTVANFNRMYRQCFVEIPSFPSGSVYMLGSTDNSTFRRITLADPNHATQWTLNSAIVVNGGIFPCPAGIQYMKLENTSGCTDAVKTVNFIGVI